MKQSSATAPDNLAEAVTVLSVSPIEEDHVSLRRILGSRRNWVIRPAATLESARLILAAGGVSVVVCERYLFPGTWQDVLSELFAVPAPPPLIVTCRVADEHLWAEALNLGAFDVLAKPFYPEEVVRVLNSAFLRRMNDIEVPQPKRNRAEAGRPKSLVAGWAM